jgi:pSer/pThr/pTyr-binding forkhead associated (FHA) protein
MGAVQDEVVEVTSGREAGTRFALPPDSESAVVGRDPAHDWLLTDPRVSRMHCRLYAQGGLLLVQDLGSTAGTLLNGAAITRVMPLRRGDVLRLGQTEVTVIAVPTPDPTLEFPAVGPPDAAVPPPPPPPEPDPVPVPEPESEPEQEPHIDLVADPPAPEPDPEVRPVVVVASSEAAGAAAPPPPPEPARVAAPPPPPPAAAEDAYATFARPAVPPPPDGGADDAPDAAPEGPAR